MCTPDADRHLSPLSYSSVLSHFLRDVFPCAISDSVVTETDGGIARGNNSAAEQEKSPSAFYFALKKH